MGRLHRKISAILFSKASRMLISTKIRKDKVIVAELVQISCANCGVVYLPPGWYLSLLRVSLVPSFGNFPHLQSLKIGRYILR